MKQAYIQKRFSAKSQKLIDTANGIIAEYQRQGYDLTLRQLYYQMVARDIVPNQQKEYKRLGNIIGDARLAGLINWRAIVDRTRAVRTIPTWSSPESVIHSALYSYRRDLWVGQSYRVEVWVEKDALRGVIRQACDKLDVPDFACRGYVSLSEMWEAGNRVLSHMRDSTTPVIVHLGDHDPSGVDMTRDITERLEMFTGGVEGRDFKVIRAALNYDQIEQFSPPPNPAKLTDSRAGGYIAEYGRSSWELDALDPSTLESIIAGIVDQYRSNTLYQAARMRQDQEKDDLQVIADNYSLALKAAKGGNGNVT